MTIYFFGKIEMTEDREYAFSFTILQHRKIIVLLVLLINLSAKVCNIYHLLYEQLALRGHKPKPK